MPRTSRLAVGGPAGETTDFDADYKFSPLERMLIPGKYPGYFADFSDFSQILLQKSCKYYHHLIVLAVECLIVLGGYTSKWPALSTDARTPAEDLRVTALFTL